MVSRRFACLFLAVSMTLSSIWIVSADQSHQIQDAAEAAASYSAAVQALEEAGLSQSAQANSNIAIDLGMLEQEETVDLSQLAVQAVQLQQEEEARQAEAARQANREALATVIATIAVIIFWCLAGFVILASLVKRRKFNGQIFLSYIIWYGLGRYWIEGLRTDALMVTSTLRTSQLVALVSVATAVVLLVAGLQRFKGAQLMVPLQVSNLKKLDAAGTYFVVDELPASASHHEFVQATAAMNRRLEEFDLDEAEKVEDNNDNGEAIEEGNVVAEPQQPAEAPETPAPEDEAGE